MEIVDQFFKPEFINRIDEIIIFEPLNLEQLTKIVDLQLIKLQNRLKNMELNLSLTETCKNKIIALGFDPIYGARPLKRAISQLIENPLATLLLKGNFNHGDHIIADLDKQDQIIFKSHI
jgi:ATP-dependent Clp protease ATP-binding subunit ClpB